MSTSNIARNHAQTTQRSQQKPLNLFPSAGMHQTIIGQTGSGKSTYSNALVRIALTAHYPLAILDTKGEELFNDLPIHSKLSQIKRDVDCIVYRPDPDELRQEDMLDSFLLRMYDRPRDGIILIDELTSLGDSPKAKPGLLSIWSRGRQHIAKGKIIHTTGVGGTQAPYFVPRVVYRQSRSFVVFRLNDEKDRQTVARFTHPALKENPKKKYGFWFFLDSATQPIETRLKLT